MQRALVLGGYGAFAAGSEAVARVPGLEVSLPGARIMPKPVPSELGRGGLRCFPRVPDGAILASAGPLARKRPLINATGPTNQDYRLARCLPRGACTIRSADQWLRAARGADPRPGRGRVVVSGASTVPRCPGRWFFYTPRFLPGAVTTIISPSTLRSGFPQRSIITPLGRPIANGREPRRARVAGPARVHAAGWARRSALRCPYRALFPQRIRACSARVWPP